jgi:hypothetical protein
MKNIPKTAMAEPKDRSNPEVLLLASDKRA